MTNIKKKIKDNLSRHFVGVRVKLKNKSKEVVKKELFIACIEKILEVEDRNEFLATETGIDIYAYTTIYYEIILNLLRMVYSEGQIEVIQNFIEKPTKEEAKINITLGKESKSYPFTTVDDLYNVIETLQNVQKK